MEQQTKAGWVKCAGGGYVRDGWKLRKITAIVDGGPAMWWLYRPNHTRYTPTGLYDDAVMWRSNRAPKREADAIINATPRVTPTAARAAAKRVQP